VDAVRKATSDVFSQALGAQWSVEIDATETAPTPETSYLCFQLTASGGLQGNAAIQIATPDGLLLAQRFLQESADPSAELSLERKEALEELLRQVAGLSATSLKSRCGETKLEVSHVEPPAWQGVIVALVASEPSSGKLSLDLRLSSELLASLSSKPVAAPAPVTDSGPTSATAAQEPNFDLLLGVNLNLTLRFGQRVLTLREILDLNSGAVIELDREVQEPADLLLGDKLIARGQVVIVDGNYGIRITEVADARQRIGTL
jgi:flagellar motor switch protein FliN/FliY